ncbi:MAG: tetratricopeptide repeat protein [Syntrophales bacterium LBB04]|nr:tetratricopeptide repeat protein [Syntrophales bacterium LBB04]
MRSTSPGILGGLPRIALLSLQRGGGNYIRTAVQFSGGWGREAAKALPLSGPSHGAAQYEAAAAAYTEALQLTPSRNDTWYSIYNSLGYSLIRCERFREAESYCRAACEIDPRRHNAVRNLGLAFQGQGRYREAARSFMTAMNLCPDDLRAYVHMEDLLYNHEEIASDMPDIMTQVEKCKGG